MRKVVCVVLFSIFLSPLSAMASPPWKVDVEFDYSTKKIQVTTWHKTRNLKNHFIKKVDIFVNGEKLQSTELTGQQNRAFQKTQGYFLEAKRGDKISAIADCNIRGSLEGEITL